MANEMGRPINYSTEEIKNIIDTYVTYTGGTVLLNASKIAKYANNELGLTNFKYYVINRNPAAKGYLEDLNKRITGASDKRLSIAKSVFTQIDVNNYLQMSKERLKVALTNLNILMEDMTNINTELIKENVKLKNRVQEKDTEIRRHKKEIGEIHNGFRQSISNSRDKSDEQNKEIFELSHKVKQQEDLLHMLWDREAENILKHNGIFEKDDAELDTKRVISEISADITKIAKEANDIFTDAEDRKISYELLKRIKDI